MLVAGLGATDLVAFSALAEKASGSISLPACYSLPDACASIYSSPLSAQVSLLPALFVIGSEAVLMLALGFSGAPRGYRLAKAAAMAGVAGLFLFVLGSSRGLKSVVPGLTPYAVYSTLTSPFVSNPMSYSDATGLYFGLAVYDVEALTFLALALAGTFVLFRERGALGSLARTLRVGSMMGVFLAADVAVFDFGEFEIHATALQSELGVLTWFTNADLLFAALGVTAATFLLARGDTSPRTGP